MPGDENKHNYCVATQDTELREKLRKVAAVPLLYINHGMLLLEPPTSATYEAAQKVSSVLVTAERKRESSGSRCC